MEHSTQEIDLSRKPAWFRKVNPYTRVVQQRHVLAVPLVTSAPTAIKHASVEGYHTAP